MKYYKSDFVYDAVKKCAEKPDELSEKCRNALAFLWVERKRVAFCGGEWCVWKVAREGLDSKWLVVRRLQ